MPFVWNEATIEYLKELIVTRELSFQQAAIEMSIKFGRHVSKNALIGKARRIGLQQAVHTFVKQRQTRAARTWTSKRDELIKHMKSQGWNDERIAINLNKETEGEFSANMIRDRLRFQEIRAKQNIQKLNEKECKKVEVKEIVRNVIEPVSSREECRWIDDETGYCAKPVKVREDGRLSSYCPEHAKIVYLPLKSKAKSENKRSDDRDDPRQSA